MGVRLEALRPHGRIRLHRDDMAKAVQLTIE